jgi:hypothetical protein
MRIKLGGILEAWGYGPLFRPPKRKLKLFALSAPLGQLFGNIYRDSIRPLFRLNSEH